MAPGGHGKVRAKTDDRFHYSQPEKVQNSVMAECNLGRRQCGLQNITYLSIEKHTKKAGIEYLCQELRRR